MTAPRVAPLLLLLAVASARSAADDPPPAFAEQVKAHFAGWDRDHDGTLSKEEIDHAVADPAVKGPEAAAVAALKRASRNTKATLPPLTPAALAELAAGKGKADLNAMYQSALGKITRANRELFAKGAPDLDALNQGKLGDCFCLAPLGAMVCRDPKDVVKMIAVKPDGSYTVRFGTTDIPVPALTDAELILTASAGADGVWVNVYEKAVGEYRKTRVAAGGGPAASPIDLIGKGGSAGSMVEVVTGHKIERFSCKPFKDAGVSAKEKEAKLADLRTHLAAAFADKRLVTCGTTAVTTPGLTPNHAYAVTGYDAKADEIALWNPHGQTFTPKEKAGPDHGYPTKDGRFTMPLAEFVKAFSGGSWETHAKAD